MSADLVHSLDYLLVDVAWWIATSYVVGRLAKEVKSETLQRLSPLFRPLAIEGDGELYQRSFRIKRWKRYLPEAGDMFEGGFDKSHLGPVGISELERFIIETERAELVHDFLMVLALVPVLFGPWYLRAASVGYAVFANLPCLMAQRYNRMRIRRVLARMRRRT